jgi:hypothetical protein
MKTLNTVVECLRAANTMRESAWSNIKRAASIAAKQAVKTCKDVKSAYESGVKEHAEILAEVSPQVRQDFNSAFLVALAALIAPETKVETKAGKGSSAAVIEPVKQVQAYDASKKAATSLRETFGLKTSGNKGKTTAAPTVEKSDDFPSWIVRLEGYFQDASHRLVMIERFAALGYTLAKAKGNKTVGAQATAQQIAQLSSIVERDKAQASAA